MQKCLTLALWTILSAPTIAMAQLSPRRVSFGAGVGVAAEGTSGADKNAFSVDAHLGYTVWHAGPVALGVDGSVWSAIDNGCDQGCNGRTRAYGGTVRGAFDFGSPSTLAVGVGTGPFRARYSKAAFGGGLDEVEKTVLGATANVDYAPRLGLVVRPALSLRGLLLPTRNATRASFISLGLELSMP